MSVNKTRPVERRKYERLLTPIRVDYISGSGNTRQSITTRNISAEGVGFETDDKGVSENEPIEMIINIPDAANPVHVHGRVVWKRKATLEDISPFDVGVEFTSIEEDNKNTFLKFLCDLLYKISKEPENGKKTN